MTVIFQKRKLAIEVDELGHKDRDQTKENKRQKDLKEYLDCEFIVLLTSLVKYRHLLISQKKRNKRTQKGDKRTHKWNKRTQQRNKRRQKINKRTKRRNKRIQRKTKRTRRQK